MSYENSNSSLRIGGIVKAISRSLGGAQTREEEAYCGDSDMGVSIPGVPMLVEGRLSGLLFADDLVGMSETILGVEKQAERISQWCDTKKSLGAKKCENSSEWAHC